MVKFHGHLLAECEQLAYRGRGKGAGGSGPVVKAANATSEASVSATTTPKGGSSPTSSTTSKPCKFYAQESGCQRANCKFVHDWANIPKEEKHDRCKGCSARGHMKRNCPLKDNEAPRKGGEGKSAPQPKVKNAQPTGPRAADEREDGTASGGGPSTASSQNTSASSTLNEPTSTSTQQGSEKAMPGEMDDFLKNATQILKIMAEKQGSGAAPPSMKMLKKAVRRMENRMALMDSGATHPLREAQPEEWSQAPEVDVVIAGDGVTTMRQNLAGTLLTEPLKPGRKPQTIVPVGNLISLLGYELIWNKKKCVLRAPDGREEALKMTSGCPEVNEAVALELIAKIEQEKVAQLQQAVEESKEAMMRP